MLKSDLWPLAMILCAFFAFLSIVACSNSNQKPAASAIEADLCKTRTAFRVAEIADSTLAPSPGTLRAKIEDAEDAFCVGK